MYSKKFPNLFPEIMEILVDSILINRQRVLLCDAPEVLNRLHIVAKTPLDEMIDMFNNVMKHIESGRGPSHSGANALFHYP